MADSPKPREESRRWIVIWPIYIDRKKTTIEGRKIPKGKAVDTPTLQVSHPA
jgi:signal recognition particle subunit SEC65